MCGKMLMWYGVGGCVKQGQVLRDKAVGDFTGNWVEENSKGKECVADVTYLFPEPYRALSI